MVDVQTVSIAVASASVVIAAIYYIFQIRNQTKIRQTDLVIRLYTTFGSKEMRQAWEKITTRESKDFNTYQKEFGLSDLNEVGWFFEGVGVLLHRKLIDIAAVDDLFSSPIKISWEKMKPVAEGERNSVAPKSGNGGNTSTMKWKKENKSFNQKPRVSGSP
jgi:hypothetical protein